MLSCEIQTLTIETLVFPAGWGGILAYHLTGPGFCPQQAGWGKEIETLELQLP